MPNPSCTPPPAELAPSAAQPHAVGSCSPPGGLFFDAIIVGAGAAGLFCAAQAGAAGLRILLIDHARRPAEKIRISGGGRCNFTNRELDLRAPQRHFVSQNPHFCRSALSRYTPQDFIALLQRHRIPFHEKHKGQLFCDGSAQELIALLQHLCATSGVTQWQPCTVDKVSFDPVVAPGADTPGLPQRRYRVHTGRGVAQAPQLVVATGGLSIPKIGATDWGHRLAHQFALPLVACRPGLVPLTFAAADWAPYAGLAGVALPVEIATGQGRGRAVFAEDLLFTHRGLSGPAILQISNYWQPGAPLEIDLLPGQPVLHNLQHAKQTSRRQLANVLSGWLPSRLADALVAQQPQWQRPIDQVPDRALATLAEHLQSWRIVPSGTEGYAKAEVTLGGVDTRALSSRTMECHAQPGLYFIGEVVDVTGWLGGYNFQWAWASAHACAGALVDGGGALAQQTR